MPGNHDTFEQLKAAKAYLASKIQDAQQRMQADSPDRRTSGNDVDGQLPTLGVVGDTAPSRPNIASMAPFAGDGLIHVAAPTALDTLIEHPSGASPLMPPVSCIASSEAIMQDEAMRVLQNRTMSQPSPIPEVCSPSHSVSAEGSAYNGTGSFAGQASLGSAVIVEDVDPVEPRLGEIQGEGDELSSLRSIEVQQETSMLQRGQQSSNIADEYEATGYSARLAWTRAELHACKDELNSAVFEAQSLRRSEEITAEIAAAATKSSEAPKQKEDLPTDLEVARLRILELESCNSELTSEKEGMSTRMTALESRVQELEEELKARPFAPDSDFEVRMAEKNRHVERLRLHAEEAAKELELRQETIDAMEARLRQAERASQFPVVGNTVHLPAKVAEVPTRAASDQARLDGAQMGLQRLSQAVGSHVLSSRQSAPSGGSSLDDARARVKLLYEQMSSRDVQAEAFGNSDVIRGRTLRTTLAASGSRENSSSNRIQVLRSASPSQHSGATAHEIGGFFDAPKNGIRGPRLQLANTWGETKLLTPQVSGVSSLTGSATQVPSPLLTPASSPQRLSPDGRSRIEVQRLRHNVSELETLMTQMAGEKARTANNLESKIVELEMQANRNLATKSSTASDGVYRLVGSHGSSTRTSSPLPAARNIEVTRTSSPAPSSSSRTVQPARTLSPTPNGGGVYYLSPQSATRSTSIKQLSSSPVPRRSVSSSRTPTQARVYSQSSIVSNYAVQQGASSTPPQQTIAVGAVSVSRSPSPAVARGQIVRDMPTPMNMAAWLGRAG